MFRELSRQRLWMRKFSTVNLIAAMTAPRSSTVTRWCSEPNKSSRSSHTTLFRSRRALRLMIGFRTIKIYLDCYTINSKSLRKLTRPLREFLCPRVKRGLKIMRQILKFRMLTSLAITTTMSSTKSGIASFTGTWWIVTKLRIELSTSKKKSHFSRP